MMPESVRLEIVEKVHNIQDILDDWPDGVLEDLCERMIERVDVLAALEMEF